MIEFLKKMAGFLKKIQEKPESTRKIIFWFVMVFLAILFFGLWVLSFQQKLVSLDRNKVRQEMNLSTIEEELKTISLPNFPKLDEKQLEELEKILSQPVLPQANEEKN